MYLFEVVEYKEHEDGSATIHFECDKETTKFLVGQGLLRVLEQAINRYEEEGK